MADEIEEARAAYQEYLKGFDQPTPSVQPQQEPQSFMGGLSESFSPSNIASGMAAPFRLLGEGAKFAFNTSQLGKLVNPSGYAETMQRVGDIPPAQVFSNVGKMASGAIPGGATAYGAAEDLATGNLKSWGEYGSNLGSELAQYAGSAALGAPIAKARQLQQTHGVPGVYPGVRRAAEIDVFNDPVSQAAIRQAEGRGFLRTEASQKAIENQRITPDIERAAAQVQGESFNAALDPTKDMLVPRALGYPESSTSPRAAAAASNLAESSKSFLETNILQGSQYNPRTAKFEGPPATVLDTQALLDRAEIASVQTIADRKNVAANLDMAHQAITADPSLPNIPKIRIEDVKAGDTIASLSETLNKRKMTVETSPVSESMQRSLDNLQQSFNQIANENFNRNPDAPGVSISEAVSMLENLNAYRKSLGEFDEAAKANNLNSTYNDFAGRASELYALKNIQNSLQEAIKSQSSAILAQTKSVKGAYDWQQGLMGVTDETIPNQNKAYGAFQDAKEAITTHAVPTEREFAAKDPNRQVNILQEKSVADQVSDPKRTFLEMVGLGKEAQDVPLQRGEKALARPQQAISDILDGLLLREKVVPILSRDWKTVKSSMNMSKELANRAIMMGIIGSPMEFDQMSEPLKYQVFQAVVATNPAGAEAQPQGLNLVDGKYTNPMEKDFIVRQNLDKPPLERYKYIGASFQDKYPTDGPLAQPQPQKQTAPDISQLNSFLSEPVAPQVQVPTDSTNMISQLEKMTALHDLDVQ